MYILLYFIVYDNFEIVVRNLFFVQVDSGTLWKNCNSSPIISNKRQQAVIKINWNCCLEKEIYFPYQSGICSLKGQLTLEPFFLIDFRRLSVEDGQFCTNFLRSWQLCTHHLLLHFIVAGYALRFFSLFFVSQILLPRHTKNNFETETKTWKPIYWSFIRHNSLIFHALILLFCSSHEYCLTFKLTSPVL